MWKAGAQGTGPLGEAGPRGVRGPGKAWKGGLPRTVGAGPGVGVGGRRHAQWLVEAPGHISSPLQLHFRRCAPESLRQGAFSSASDVWMFGVTLWEMFSGGKEPWAWVPPYLILQRLEKDQARLPRPPLCSRALYTLALRCWALRPADRPSFSSLEGLIQEVGTLASPISLPSIPSPRVPCPGLTILTPGLGAGTSALNRAVPTCRALRALGSSLVLHR